MATTTFNLPYGEYVLMAVPRNGPFSFSANCDTRFIQSSGPDRPDASRAGILLTLGVSKVVAAQLDDSQHLWVIRNGPTVGNVLAVVTKIFGTNLQEASTGGTGSIDRTISTSAPSGVPSDGQEWIVTV